MTPSRAGPTAIVSDSRLYGTIGVVFTLLTWFIAIGAVIVLGAVADATGPKPAPDLARLRRDLDAAGLAGVDVRVSLVTVRHQPLAN